MKSFATKITPPDPLVIDPYWDRVALYQRFDGGVLTDLTGNYTVGTSGTISSTTTQPKFGTHSLAKSSGGFITYTPASGAKMSFGTGDFTIEYWIYWNGNYPTSNNYGGFSVANNTNGTPGGAWVLYTGSSGASTFNISWYDGSGFSPNVQATQSGVSVNTWHHFAVTRQGSTIRTFLDGNMVLGPTNYTRSITEASPRLGTDAYSESGYAAYYDEVRVTTGIARYTQSFALPVKQFPTPTLP